MFRKTLAVVLSAIILSAGTASAQTLRDARAEKARAFVTKRGTGESARVTVRLRDERRVKGYISRSDEDSFTVVDPKTGATSEVAFADVEQVKKPGGFPTKWVVLGGAAAAAIIVGVTVIEPVLCDGGAGC